VGIPDQAAEVGTPGQAAEQGTPGQGRAAELDTPARKAELDLELGSGRRGRAGRPRWAAPRRAVRRWVRPPGGRRVVEAQAAATEGCWEAGAGSWRTW